MGRIIKITEADGTKTSREIIYTDKDKLVALSSLQNRKEIFGFRHRLIKPVKRRPGVGHDEVNSGKELRHSLFYNHDMSVNPSLSTPSPSKVTVKLRPQNLGSAKRKAEQYIDMSDIDNAVSTVELKSLNNRSQTPNKSSKRSNSPVNKEERAKDSNAIKPNVLLDPLKAYMTPRRKDRSTGRQLLNPKLRLVTEELIKWQKAEAWDLFRAPVVKSGHVEDYNSIVPVKDEMWLERILNKAKAGRYS